GMHLVTLLTPLQNDRDAPVSEVRELSAGDVAGFSARFPQGVLIWLTTTGEPVELRAGPIVAVASSLLWWEDEAGESVSGGIVLGARSVQVGDRPQQLPSPDLEFSVQADSLTNVQPILRPISAPVIEPPQAVFTDSLVATISCDTPEAEIHYTL